MIPGGGYGFGRALASQGYGFGIGVPTIIGGDDAFHKHIGWDRKAWKKRQKREEALLETITNTYLKLIGKEPQREEVIEIKAKIVLPDFNYKNLEVWQDEMYEIVDKEVKIHKLDLQEMEEITILVLL